MPEPFIIPNWHVVILHIPLGLLAAGFVIEILSVACPRSSIRTGARWMMLIGALMAIPTIALGMYGFRQIAAPTADVESTWRQVVAKSTWSEVQWRYMTYHIWLEVVGALLAIKAATLWLAYGGNNSRRVYGFSLLLMAIGLGSILTGAWFSGEAVYRHGTAVAAVSPGIAGQPTESTSTRTESHEPSHSSTQSKDAHAQAESHKSAAAIDEHEKHEHEATDKLARYLPPIQVHLLLAGLTIALAAAAISLTIRRWSQLHAHAFAPPPPPRALIPRSETAAGDQPGQPVATAGPAAISQPVVCLVFPARFWLTTFICALLAALAGLWLADDWTLATLLEPLQHRPVQLNHRDFWHVIFGITIIIMSLILALSTRLAPRSRVLNSIWIALLWIAVILQIWMGVLLLYDGMNGPLTGFTA